MMVTILPPTKPIRTTPAALSDAFITSLVEDPSGALWVGTYYGGLNRLDREMGEFVQYQPDANNPNALPSERVNALLMTSTGQLWCGTRSGLSVLDEDRQSFTTYTHDPQSRASLSDDEVLSLYEDEDGIIWAGTADGLNIFNPDLGTFHPLSGSGDYKHVAGERHHRGRRSGRLGRDGKRAAAL